MNSYQNEQFEAFKKVTQFLIELEAEQIRQLQEKIEPYLLFRDSVDDFLSSYFSHICTQSCYRNQRSACCSKDGIITFFGDVLINALCSSPPELQSMAQAIQTPKQPTKCIFLDPQGCVWRIKPAVCVMFICDRAQEEVFFQHPKAKMLWEQLKAQERTFKWPDKPVLFDWLENYALKLGVDSPLMYMHKSPGLMRIKKRAGLI